MMTEESKKIQERLDALQSFIDEIEEVGVDVWLGVADRRKS